MTSNNILITEELVLARKFQTCLKLTMKGDKVVSLEVTDTSVLESNRYAPCSFLFCGDKNTANNKAVAQAIQKLELEIGM